MKINKMGGYVAIEPSENASVWLSDNPDIELLNGYFPAALQNKKNLILHI